MSKKIGLKFNGHKWQVCLRDDIDRSVFNEIFKFHEYRIAEDVIKNAKYPIVDVGAHAGFFSLYCRGLNDKVQIFALEPEPNNLQALDNHLEDNNIVGVEILNVAMASSSGIRQLVLSEDSQNHKLSDDSKNISGIMKVKSISFSDFLNQNKIKKISLLKFDIEGGEYEVFESMSEKDLSVVNNIVLEYHFGRKKSKEIEEKLRDNGFSVQVLPSKFDKTMGFIFARNKRNF